MKELNDAVFNCCWYFALCSDGGGGAGFFFPWGDWGGGKIFACPPPTHRRPCFLTRACPPNSVSLKISKILPNFFSQFFGLLFSSKLHQKALFHVLNIKIFPFIFGVGYFWPQWTMENHPWKQVPHQKFCEKTLGRGWGGDFEKFIQSCRPSTLHSVHSWWRVRKHYNPLPLTIMWMNNWLFPIFLDCLGYQQ